MAKTSILSTSILLTESETSYVATILVDASFKNFYSSILYSKSYFYIIHSTTKGIITVQEKQYIILFSIT